VTPAYLLPYERAAGRGGVRAMLFPDQRAQAVRFAAIARHCPLAGRSVLDVGCGRADLLAWLRARGEGPRDYVGIEAQPGLASEARSRRYADSSIHEGDFVAQPALLQVGAQVVVFSGSLNLLDAADFYRALRSGWSAAGEALVFNFLSSPRLAGAPWLRWHLPEPVARFARSLTPFVTLDDTYEPGDCTVVMRKPPRPPVE
jgi:SAM-dependent methyltransferase